MKKNMRGMTLAAILLSASTSVWAGEHEYVAGDLSPQAFAGETAGNVVGDTSPGMVGDLSPTLVGDLKPSGVGDLPPSVVREATVAASTLPSAPNVYPRSANSVGDMLPTTVGDLALPMVDEGRFEAAPAAKIISAGSSEGRSQGSPVAPIRDYAPLTAGDLRPTGFMNMGLGKHAGNGCDTCSDSSCDGSSCDGGCDSGGRSKSSMFSLCTKDGWLRAEAMLMFMGARQSPPLVTTSAPGTFPVLPDANVAFGDPIETGLSAGVRLDGGTYVSDTLGIGGRLLWLSENSDDYSASGNQFDPNQPSIGRPYFYVPLTNPGIGGEDAEFVAASGLFSGTVNAQATTDLAMGEAYLRHGFCKNANARVEFIGGYTFAALDDRVSIISTTTDLQDQTLPSTTFASDFDARNRFNGGQLGFESFVSRGCWSARALTKVHLGNMHQTVNIRGYTEDRLAGTLVGRQNSSLLVGADQGTETRDQFTFIPELDFTVGYRFRDHVSFTVGYTFMYFDQVAMAGQQINRYRDTANLGENVVPQGFDIVDGNLWVQGISLGASVDF